MKRILGLLVVIIVVAASCVNPNDANSNLSGKIRNVNFSYTSATATTYGTYWYIKVLGGSDYPFIGFVIPKSNSAQTYAVTTYGTSSGSLEGVQINGMISSTLGTYFDSGKLIIDSIDSLQISGHISDAKTVENTSSLNGLFTATIQ